LKDLHIKRFGLLGKTLKHSFSKTFFEEMFKKNGIYAEYENYELDSVEKIPELLSQNLSGLNVTIPYKEAVLEFLGELSKEAKEIGAVNCIQFIKGKTIGHNTDIYGFHQLIKPYLKSQHQQALILGTGGSAKAVAYVLKKIGVKTVFISRNPKTNDEFHYSEINNYMINSCKLIVNCTPVGMFPHTQEVPNFPFKYLTQEHLVIDLIYNPLKTVFLQKSETMNVQILNGHTMLVQQALKTWDIWIDDIAHVEY